MVNSVSSVSTANCHSLIYHYITQIGIEWTVNLASEGLHQSAIIKAQEYTHRSPYQGYRQWPISTSFPHLLIEKVC